MMSKENMVKREIKKDIQKINEALIGNLSEDDLKNVHISIDGKYQSKISNWGFSQYGWIDNSGFSYELISKESLKANLKNMESKLEGYLQDYRYLTPDSPISSINIINSNTNNTNMDIKINLKTLINKINNMESLTKAETDEAIKKVKEIEDIYNSKSSKKEKWEKLKSILKWLADKSVDLTIEYLPVIINILK